MTANKLWFIDVSLKRTFNEKTSPKGFSASKCDVGNWIFSKSWEFLGGNFLGYFFLRNFWEEFFERIFLGEIFCEVYFGRNFLGGFFGRNFLGGIFRRNSLSTFLKLFEIRIWKGFFCLSRFWFLSRFWVNGEGRKENFQSLEVQRQAHRT